MTGWIRDGGEVIRAWPHRVGVRGRTQILEVEMEINLIQSGESVHKETCRNFLPGARRNYPRIKIYELHLLSPYPYTNME